MNKAIFSLFLLIAIGAGGQPVYQTDNRVHYYADSINKKNSYIDSQCTMNIYYPKNLKNFATVVWFHGGGLSAGNNEIPEGLMNKGVAVISVEYRFSPRVKAPAYIEDAAAAVAWVFRNIANYGGSNRLIFVSGHSAGGYLGMMLTLDKHYLEKYQVDADSIASLIPFSGHTITHFTIRQENNVKSTRPIIDEYAPLFHVRAEAPPMLLITGDRELELLGRYEENAYMWRMMQLAGHKATRLYELDGFDHGGMAEPAFPLLLKEVARVKKMVEEKKGQPLK